MISSSSSFLLLKKSRLRTLSGKISPATRTHSRQLRTTQKRTKEQKRTEKTTLVSTKKNRFCCFHFCCRIVIIFVVDKKRTSRLSASLSLALFVVRRYSEYYVSVTPVLLMRINMCEDVPLSFKKSSFFCFFCFFFCSRPFSS